MSFLAKIFGEKKKTAAIAKNRLSVLIAHERSGGAGVAPDFLPALQRELLEVISKYVSVNQDDIKVHLDKQDNCDVLEVNIVLPEQKSF